VPFPLHAVAALNAQRFPVTTLMVIDEHHHGLPVAHIIHSSSSADTMVQVFNALRDFVGVQYQPKFIIVDDCDAEIAAIEECVWGIKGCKVALCNWHVKRAWLVNLIKKLPGKPKRDTRLEIFDALQDIQGIKVCMLAWLTPPRRPHSHARAWQTEAEVLPALDAFKAKYAKAEPAFYDYFQKEWLANLKYKKWIAFYRGDDCPTTTSALEAYHGVIKLLFTCTRCVNAWKPGFYKTCRVL